MKSSPTHYSIPEEPSSEQEQLQIEEASSYRETLYTSRSQDSLTSPTSRSQSEELKVHEKNLMHAIGKVSTLKKELAEDEKHCLMTPRERFNKLHSLQQNLINLAELYGKMNQDEVRKQYIAHANIAGLKMVALQVSLPQEVAKTVYVNANHAMAAAELKGDWQEALEHAGKAREKAREVLSLSSRVDVREAFQAHIERLDKKVEQFQRLVSCRDNQVAPDCNTPKNSR